MALPQFIRLRLRLLSGAAIALIDAVFLHLNLPSVTTRFVGYGLPRVGNQDWANYVDSLPVQVTHVNNEEDIIPILPGKFLGFHHPSGEVHIQDSGAWLACPGAYNARYSVVLFFFIADIMFGLGPQVRTTRTRSASWGMCRTSLMATSRTTMGLTMGLRWDVEIDEIPGLAGYP